MSTIPEQVHFLTSTQEQKCSRVNTTDSDYKCDLEQMFSTESRMLQSYTHNNYSAPLKKKKMVWAGFGRKKKPKKSLKFTTDWDVSELWSKPLKLFALTTGSKNWTHLCGQTLTTDITTVILARGCWNTIILVAGPNYPKKKNFNDHILFFSFFLWWCWLKSSVWNKWKILKVILRHGGHVTC